MANLRQLVAPRTPQQPTRENEDLSTSVKTLHRQLVARDKLSDATVNRALTSVSQSCSPDAASTDARRVTLYTASEAVTIKRVGLVMSAAVVANAVDYKTFDLVVLDTATAHEEPVFDAMTTASVGFDEKVSRWFGGSSASLAAGQQLVLVVGVQGAGVALPSFSVSGGG